MRLAYSYWRNSHKLILTSMLRVAHNRIVTYHVFFITFH